MTYSRGWNGNRCVVIGRTEFIFGSVAEPSAYDWFTSRWFTIRRF